MLITKNGKTTWVPDYGGQTGSIFTNPVDEIKKIAPRPFSVSENVLGETPAKRLYQKFQQEVVAPRQRAIEGLPRSKRLQKYREQQEADTKLSDKLKTIFNEDEENDLVAETIKKQQEETQREIEKRKEEFKKRADEFYYEWAQDQLGYDRNDTDPMHVTWANHMARLRKWADAAGMFREDQLETRLKSLRGEYDMLDTKQYALDAHNIVEETKRSISAIEEQRNLNTELYGITPEDLLKTQKDQRTLEYLEKDKQYSDQLDQLRLKLNNPELQNLDNIYKADQVGGNYGKRFLNWLTTSVGSIDPSMNDKLAQDVRRTQNAEIAAQYEDVIRNRYFYNTAKQQEKQQGVFDFQNQRQLEERIKQIKANTPKTPEEAEQYLSNTRNLAEQFAVKQAQENITKEKEKIKKDTDDLVADIEDSKDFWRTTDAYRQGKELFRDEALWSPYYWFYEIPSMMGSTLSSPAQLASMGVQTAGTIAGLTGNPLLYNAAMIASTPLQAQGGFDENYAEIHDKRVENIKDMINDPQFTGQDEDAIYEDLIEQSKAYWLEHGLTEEQVDRRFEGSEGMSRAIEDLIAGRTYNNHPGVQKALLLSTRGLSAQFWADNVRTMSAIPFQTAMLLMPTKGIKTLSYAETQAAKRGARRVFSKEGKLVAEQEVAQGERAAGYLNEWRKPTIKESWERGKEVGETAAGMMGFGYFGEQAGKYIGGATAATIRAAREALPKGMRSFADDLERGLVQKYRGIADALTPSSNAARLLARYTGMAMRRGLAESFSEAAEEAVQYLNQQEDFASQYGWNTPTFDKLIANDIRQGGRVLDFYLSLFGLSNSELVNDLEFIENWKGGFALGGGHGQIMQAPAMLGQAYQEYKVNAPEVVNAFVNRTMESYDRAMGVGVAKSAMEGNGAAILRQIDEMQKADNQRKNPKFTQAEWDERRAQAQEIIQLATSPATKARLEKLGFEYGTDKYANAVADIFNIQDKIDRNNEARELNASDTDRYYGSKVFEEQFEIFYKPYRQSPDYVQRATKAMDAAEKRARESFAARQNREEQDREEYGLESEENPIDDSKQSRLDEEVRLAREDARKRLEEGDRAKLLQRQRTIDRIKAILQIKQEIGSVDNFFDVLNKKFGLKTLRQDTKLVLDNINQQLEAAKKILIENNDVAADISDEELLKYVNDNGMVYQDQDVADTINANDVVLNADRAVLQYQASLSMPSDIDFDSVLQEPGKDATKEEKRLYKMQKESFDALKKMNERNKKRYSERIDQIMQADLDNKTINWVMNDVFSGDAVTKLEEEWLKQDQEDYKELLEKVNKQALDIVGQAKQTSKEQQQPKPKAKFGKNKQKWEQRKQGAKQRYLDRKRKYNKWVRGGPKAMIAPVHIFFPLINKAIQLIESGVYSIAEFVEDVKQFDENIDVDLLKQAYIQFVSDVAKQGDLAKLSKLSTLQEIVEYQGDNRFNPPLPPDESAEGPVGELQKRINQDYASVVQEVSSHAATVTNENGNYHIYINQVDVADYTRSWLYRYANELKQANTSDESFRNKLKWILSLNKDLAAIFDPEPFVRNRNIPNIEHVALMAAQSSMRELSPYVQYAERVRDWVQAIMLDEEDQIPPGSDVTPEFIEAVKEVQRRLKVKGYEIINTKARLFGQDFDGNNVTVQADIVAMNKETGDVIIGDVFSSYRNMEDSLDEYNRHYDKTRRQVEEQLLNQIASIFINRYGIPVKSIFAMAVQYDGLRAVQNGPAKVSPTIRKIFTVNTMFNNNEGVSEETKSKAQGLVEAYNSLVDEYNGAIQNIKGGERKLYTEATPMVLDEFETEGEYDDYIRSIESQLEELQSRKQEANDLLVLQNIEDGVVSETIPFGAEEENPTVEYLRAICTDLDNKLQFLPIGPAVTDEERQNLQIIYRTIFDAQDILNQLLYTDKIDPSIVYHESKLILSAIEKVIVNQKMFEGISHDVMQQWLDAFIPNETGGNAQTFMYYRNSIPNWVDVMQDHIMNDIDSNYSLQVWYSTLLNYYFTPLLNKAQEFSDRLSDPIQKDFLNQIIKQGRKFVDDFNLDYGVEPDAVFKTPPANEIERINRMPVKWNDLYGVSDKHSPSYSFIEDLNHAQQRIYAWITAQADLLQDYATTDDFRKVDGLENKTARFRIYRDTDGQIKLTIGKGENSIVGQPFIVDESRYQGEKLERAKQFNRGNRKFLRAIGAMLDYIQAHPEEKLQLVFEVTRNKGKVIYDAGQFNSVEDYLFANEQNKHDLFSIRISASDGIGILRRQHNVTTGKETYVVSAGGVRLGGFDEEYDKQKLAMHAGALVYFLKNNDKTSIGTFLSRRKIGDDYQKIYDLIYEFAVKGKTHIEYKGVSYNIQDLLRQVLYLRKAKRLTEYNSTTNMFTINQGNPNVYISNQMYNLQNEQQRNEFKKALRNVEYTSEEELLNETIIQSENSALIKAVQLIREGADRVELPNGFVITREDVEKNTTMLGYMMRNKYFGTTVVGMGYRQLNIGNARIVSQEEAKQTNAKKADDIRKANKDDVSDEIKDLFDKAKRRAAQDRDGLNDIEREEKLVRRTDLEKLAFEEKATSFFDRVFGSHDDLKIIEEVKAVSPIPTGAVAVGRTTALVVEIAKNAPESTIYHEAFHKLIELLFTEKERNELYEMYRNRRKFIFKGAYKELSDREVAEGLADLFTACMNTAKESENAKSWYKKIWAKLKRIGLLLGMYYRLGISDTNKIINLCNDFEGGKFKNRKSSEANQKRFEELFGEGLNRTVTNYKTGKQADFKELTNSAEINSMVRQISYLMLDAAGIIDEVQPDTSLIEIDSKAVSKIPQNIIDAITGAGKRIDQLTRRERAFREVFEFEKVVNYDEHGHPISTERVYPKIQVLQEKIKNYIESITHAYSSTLNDDLNNDEEEKVIHANIDKFDRSSTEFDKLDNVSDIVKLFFATIPYSKFENGKLVLDHSKNQFGLPELMPLSEVYKRIVTDLGDVNTLEELNDGFKKLSEQNAMYAQIYDKWSMLYKDMKTENEDGSLHIDWSKEAMCINIMRAIKSYPANFVISYTDSKKNGQRTRILNSSENRDQRTFAAQWNTLLSSGTFGIFNASRRNGALSFRTKEDSTVFTDTAKFIEQLINALSFNKESEVAGIKYNPDVVEHLDSLKTEFILRLNKIGIQFSRDALDHHLLNQYGSINKEAFLKWLTKTDAKTNITSFIMMLNEMAPNGIPNTAYIDKAYKENGFINSLATIQSTYNRRVKQNMAYGLNGKKLYSVTQNNTITHIVNQLNSNNPENSLAQVLSRFSYNYMRRNGVPIGSIIMRDMLDEKTPLHITSSIYIGSKTDHKNDGGTEYKDTPMTDDYIAKMTMLQEGWLIFPTLADKGTWMCLQGVAIPGMQFSKDYASVTGCPTIMQVNGRYYLRPSDKVLMQMDEYAFTERQAIQECMEQLGYDNIHGYEKQGLKVLSDNEKVANYHTPHKDKPTGKIVEPNGTRFWSLTELIVEKDGKLVPINLNDPNEDSNTLLKRANDEYFSKPLEERMHIMALTLARQTSEEVKMAERLGLIKRVDVQIGNEPALISASDKGISNLENKYLNSVQIATVEEQLMKNSRWANLKPGSREHIIAKKIAHSLAIAAILQDANIRSIISAEEVMRCFSGHPGQFKVSYDFDNGCIKDSTFDIQKRIGGLISTGDDNVTDVPYMKSVYNCAEVKDYEVASKSAVAQQLEEMFIEGEVRDAYGVVTGKWEEAYTKPIEELKKYNSTFIKKAIERGKKYAKAYKGGINVADGSAYITADMCKQLLRARGVFSGKVAKAFAMLEGKSRYSWKDTKSAYKLLYETLNEVGAPLVTTKYTAYGFRSHQVNGRAASNMAVAYYNKYALFPLFHCNATGHMKAIYKKMLDEKVDMLMFDSAVKVGSQGASKFENGEIQGKFNVYQQELSFLRRQLNTDPEEGGTSNFGTQAMKIALQSIRLGRRGEAGYVDEADPNVKHDGSDLLNTLMESIKALADIGEEEIKEMFFDKNGFVDGKKLSKYLQKEMGTRNANTATVEAVQYDKDTDSTTIPLAATTNSAWIQSIIIATVNKHVVDVVTPGNSFVQRSVFAIEDKAKAGEGNIQGDQDIENTTINGGKRLEMINSDGSMDAVISIDYFKDILKIAFPNGCSFNEAREWLIKNKIIGNSPDVRANTIGYRIPTQAQSSIHALRFVDVVEATQATIILPEEFTRITGSDFDIDHLYLASFNYNVAEDGTVSNQFKDGKKFYQNKILSVLLTVLKDKKSRNIAFKSIDNDTELPKSIADMIQPPANNKKYSYNFGSLHEQVERRLDYVTGQKGIGPFALNVTNAVLTYLYGVEFRRNGFTSSTRIGSLHQLVDKNGDYVSSWLSGFINAHVDIVKDPWISKLDVNPYTYNMLALLIRSGYGEAAVWFLSQPIIKDLAQSYAMTQSEYTRDMTVSKYIARKNAEKKVLLKYMTEFEFSDQKRNIYEGAKKEYDGMRAQAVNDVLGDVEYLKEQALAQEKDIDNNYQKEVYYAWLSLQKYAFALNSLIQTTKIDTRKQGKSFIELAQYMRKFNKLFKNPKSIFDKDSLQRLATRSWIQKKTDLAIGLPFQIFEEQIFEACEGFRDILFDWASLLETENRDLSTDALKTLSRAFITSIKSKYVVNYAKQTLGMDDAAITALFVGKRTMAKRLNALKYHIQNNPSFAYLKENGLLQRLEIVPPNDDKNSPEFITVLDNVDGSRLEEDMLSDGWADLLDDPNPQVKRFAKDLIVYSFLSSGEYNGWNKTFKYVPVSWILGKHDDVQISFAQYIRKELQSMKGAKSRMRSLQTLLEIAANNIRDYNISQPIRLQDDSGNQNYTPIKNREQNTVALIQENTEDPDDDPMFVTLKTGSTYRTSSYDIYVKVATAKKDGKYCSIYAVIKKQGYNEGMNSIYQYGWDFQYLYNGKDYNILNDQDRLASIFRVVENKGWKHITREYIDVAAGEAEEERYMNIWWGSGEEDPEHENGDLSNFANRPFTVTNVGDRDNLLIPIAGTFQTVEGAFQAQKLAYTNSYSEEEKQRLIEQLEKATGSEAKSIGGNIVGLDKDEWDSLSSDFMYNLLLDSFRQNTDALQRLLDTEDIILTHNQAKGKWKTEFPRLLMQVRDSLFFEQNNSKLPTAPPAPDSGNNIQQSVTLPEDDRSEGENNIQIEISTTPYRKEDPKNNPETLYVFTENAQASIKSRMTAWKRIFDELPAFKEEELENVTLNVGDYADTDYPNQAGVRTDAEGNVNNNAIGIVVKKMQQDKTGKFLKKEGQFQDTDEDFEVFRMLNDIIIVNIQNKLYQGIFKNVKFPQTLALGKAALPFKFCTWLQSELAYQLGIISKIEKNTTPGYDGYGLRLVKSLGGDAISNIEDKFDPEDEHEDDPNMEQAERDMAYLQDFADEKYHEGC